MTRVWGGRSLETIYQRNLPDDQPYGESWEMSDRPDEQSIVSSGPYAGKSLHDLWTNHREAIFGKGFTGDRFPLLIKILDARDDLSIQVNPPENLSRKLGGEPKTEMWYIADCDPGAKLYIGLKDKCTRETFQQSLSDGTEKSKSTQLVQNRANRFSSHHVDCTQSAPGSSFMKSSKTQTPLTGFLIGIAPGSAALHGTFTLKNLWPPSTSMISNLEWINQMATLLHPANTSSSNAISFRSSKRSRTQTILFQSSQ